MEKMKRDMMVTICSTEQQVIVYKRELTEVQTVAAQLKMKRNVLAHDIDKLTRQYITLYSVT